MTMTPFRDSLLDSRLGSADGGSSPTLRECTVIGDGTAMYGITRDSTSAGTTRQRTVGPMTTPPAVHRPGFISQNTKQNDHHKPQRLGQHRTDHSRTYPWWPAAAQRPWRWRGGRKGGQQRSSWWNSCLTTMGCVSVLMDRESSPRISLSTVLTGNETRKRTCDITYDLVQIQFLAIPPFQLPGLFLFPKGQSWQQAPN